MIPNNNDLHHRESAALAPVLQSVVTGLVLAGLVAWMVITLRIQDPLSWIAGGFLVGFAGYWWSLQRHWMRLTGPAAPSASYSAEPVPNISKLEVWVHHPRVGGMGKSERVSFDASPDVMRTLAQGLLAGRPFTRAVWVASGTLTDDQHRKIVGEMLERGLLRYKVASNPRNGTELTPAGRQVMQSICDASPAPMG